MIFRFDHWINRCVVWTWVSTFFPSFFPPRWTSEWHFFENVLCSLCRSFNSHSLMWRLETWETLTVNAVSCPLIQPCILPLVTGLFGLHVARILDISSLFLSRTFSFLSICLDYISKRLTEHGKSSFSYLSHARSEEVSRGQLLLISCIKHWAEVKYLDLLSKV